MTFKNVEQKKGSHSSDHSFQWQIRPEFQISVENILYQVPLVNFSNNSIRIEWPY